jgi:hypothetical protein
MRYNIEIKLLPVGALAGGSRENSLKGFRKTSGCQEKLLYYHRRPMALNSPIESEFQFSYFISLRCPSGILQDFRVIAYKLLM